MFAFQLLKIPTPKKDIEQKNGITNQLQMFTDCVLKLQVKNVKQT